VNSEHLGRAKNDYIRKARMLDIFLNQSLIKDHEISKYGCGTLDTLKGEALRRNLSLRAEMVAFYQKFYSANIMTATIYGKHSLDVLQRLAVSLLVQVPNRSATKSVWLQNPRAQPYTGFRLNHATINDVKELTVIFGMPAYQKQDLAIVEYADMLFSNEQEGSLRKHLKARELIVDFSTDYDLEARGYGTFTVMFTLTDQGVKKTDEILQLLFKYLNLIKKRGAQSWELDQLTRQRQNAFNTLV